MTRPDDLFYHVWEISDLFYEEPPEPPNISIELNLTATGKVYMGVFLDGVTFINVEVIE